MNAQRKFKCTACSHEFEVPYGTGQAGNQMNCPNCGAQVQRTESGYGRGGKGFGKGSGQHGRGGKGRCGEDKGRQWQDKYQKEAHQDVSTANEGN